jgi:penicillin amidase
MKTINLLLLFATTFLIVYISHLYYQRTQQHVIDSKLPTNKPVTFKNGKTATFTRQSNGLLHIDTVDHDTFAGAMGYVHAHERYAQLFTLRLIAQGRLSECLANSEESFTIDSYIRQLSFAANARKSVIQLSNDVTKLVESYAQGINQYIATHDRPIEFLLTNYYPEPWTVADSLTIAYMIGYVGLASAQLDHEKFILQSLKTGNPDAKRLLQRLYEPHLDRIDNFVPQEILEKLRIEVPLIPEHMALFKKIPQFMGSNNWAVGSKKSESGSPIMAFDPHLDVSRLPGFWYESTATIAQDNTSIIGITIPGMFGFAMGRNEKLSMSFTYGFADMIDYYIEDCKDMKCRDGDEYVPVKKSVSILKRKGDTDVEIILFRTRNGILELSNASRHDFDDGLYLSRAYTHDSGPGGIGTLSGICTMYRQKTVEDFEEGVQQIDTSTNMIVAHEDGTLAYFQTALIPIRPHSGLFPLLGWIKDHQWKGFVPGKELKRIYNPDENYLVSANNDFRGEHLVVNVHMGEYRAQRIKSRLESKKKLSVEDMKSIQSDVYSTQAEAFMDVFRPILKKNEHPLAQQLAGWDLRYNAESRGAFLFEHWYRALLKEVYGQQIGNGWDLLIKGPTFINFFVYLDRLILEYNATDDDILWQGRSREQLFSQVYDKVIHKLVDKNQTETTYGEWHTFTMSNQFYKAILPDQLATLLGIHHGPYPFEGSRATPQQAQKFAQGKLETTFAASYRFVSDLATKVTHTVVPGGPSDNILSSLYSNEIKAYLKYSYKKNTL